jgi:hypothetical protein
MVHIHRRRCAHPVRCFLDSPCSIAHLISEQATGIARTAWDENEQLKNALSKQSTDARAGLVCVAVGAGFQIVSKLIEQFFS